MMLTWSVDAQAGRGGVVFSYFLRRLRHARVYEYVWATGLRLLSSEELATQVERPPNK